MNCFSVESVLDLYAEGRLAPGRAKAVTDHLRACARCAALAESLRPKAAAVKAPAGLMARLKTLTPDTARRAAPREKARFLGRESLPVLFAFVLACALAWVLHAAGGGAPSQRHLPLPPQQEDL